MKTRTPAPVIVAIPVKDEAERLGSCLSALQAQRDAPPIEVVLLLNNCTDDSASVARAFAARSPLAVHVEQRVLPPGQASAGVARSLAMQWADRLASTDGVLVTTDADSVAPPDWIAENLAAIADVDAVAGRAVIDPVEARLIPERLHEDDARECAYAALLDEIAALLDPDPADPWPRHDEHSGASIAVRVAAYRAAGGMPAIPLGEDRGFFTALRRIDARVRHAPEVWVTVSGRIEGRAQGGMADTIRRRLDQPDSWIDDRLECVATASLRATLRRLARLVRRGAEPARAVELARALGVRASMLETATGAPSFGLEWDALERCSPALQRSRVPVAALARETARARSLRDRLRQAARAPSRVDEHFPGLVE